MIDNEFTDSDTSKAIKKYNPSTALVLGSGLGSFVQNVNVLDEINYSDIEGVPVSKVSGHEGKLVISELGEKRIVIAQGRVHLYEGYSAKEVTSLVRLMAASGCERLVLTNAAGSTDAKNAVGTWLSITDHLNLTGTTPLLGNPSFIDMSEVYSKALVDQFKTVAESINVNLNQGVYAGLLGPQYETPAEIKMLQKLGADAVGMSTVLEATMGHALGLEVAGFSCLTNLATGIGGKALEHKDVLEIGNSAADELVQILLEAFKRNFEH